MNRVQEKISDEYPNIRSLFSSGSMVDAFMNTGMPGPIDVQVSGRNLQQTYDVAQDLSGRVHQLKGVLGKYTFPRILTIPDCD